MNAQSTAANRRQLQEYRKAISPATKIVRAVAIVAIVLVGVFIFTVTTSRTDYISYWSAGKLLMHHSDPYSPAGAFALERQQGFTAGFMVMLNPPWALFLAAPLGFVGIRAGLFLWTLICVGCLFFSAQLLEVPSQERAFAYVFAPAVAAIFMGQSSPFFLLGFSLFLRFHCSRPFLAGAALLLMAIKPHLFFVFWALLLLDCLYRRRFRIVAGGVTALVAASAFAMYFDPRIWQDYRTMLQASVLKYAFFPTASMLFRMLIDVHAFWLLFVPSALTVLWGVWYYLSRRQIWDWRIHGMLLMLVSILFAPYSWLTDEAVLLPSILFALTFTEKRKYSTWILLAINTAVLLIALGEQASLKSRAYMWTPVTWLLWFLYTTKSASQSENSPAPLAETPQPGNAQP
jgi:Glycosyltransferase family 87